MPIRRSLMTIALTTWAVALDGSSSSTTEIKVVVYEGPESCPVFDADKKHIKVQKDCTVAFHFTASDEATGRKIESSHDLGIAPSFPGERGRVSLVPAICILVPHKSFLFDLYLYNIINSGTGQSYSRPRQRFDWIVQTFQSLYYYSASSCV